MVRSPGSAEGQARLVADLPKGGDLGPLFRALGLIDDAELAAGVGAPAGGSGWRDEAAAAARRDGAQDVDLVEWLAGTVRDAAAASDRHAALADQLSTRAAASAARLGLASLHVGASEGGSAAGASTSALLTQVDALEAFEAAAAAARAAAGPDHLAGVAIGVVPGSPGDSRPLVSLGDDGLVTCRACSERVGALAVALRGVDSEQAAALARTRDYWAGRVSELQGPVRDFLGVRHVWCDARAEGDARRFVLWAGAVLSADAPASLAAGLAELDLSVLVHCDSSTPQIDYLPASSVLQVRSDCPPAALFRWLTSDIASSSSAEAAKAAARRSGEDELLEEAREALGAKHVIRVCTSDPGPSGGPDGDSAASVAEGAVAAAACRLRDAAPTLAAAGISLRGASLAIDDCYEVWDSGFISIPYDFTVGDLSERLARLGAGSGDGGEGGGGAPPPPALGRGAVGAGALPVRPGPARRLAVATILPIATRRALAAVPRITMAPAVRRLVVRAGQVHFSGIF